VVYEPDMISIKKRVRSCLGLFIFVYKLSSFVTTLSSPNDELGIGLWCWDHTDSAAIKIKTQSDIGLCILHIMV